jgi:hypothetical protein
VFGWYTCFYDSLFVCGVISALFIPCSIIQVAITSYILGRIKDRKRRLKVTKKERRRKKERKKERKYGTGMDVVSVEYDLYQSG